MLIFCHLNAFEKEAKENEERPAWGSSECRCLCGWSWSVLVEAQLSAAGRQNWPPCCHHNHWKPHTGNSHPRLWSVGKTHTSYVDLIRRQIKFKFNTFITTRLPLFVCFFPLVLCFSPESEVSVLVGVALRSLPIGAVHTVGGSANPTHLAQREVICPALMLP